MKQPRIINHRWTRTSDGKHVSDCGLTKDFHVKPRLGARINCEACLKDRRTITVKK